MGSIVILDSGRKEKRVKRACPNWAEGLCLFSCLFLAAAFFFVVPGESYAAEGGSVTMGTPGGGGAVIGTDPGTGSQVMKTPEPKPQEEYQGPQTIIVSPEVYPNYPGSRPLPPKQPR